MRILAATVAIALVASAGAAAAQQRVSDERFVDLARCAGLAQGSGLEAQDLDSALRANRRGRSDHVRERATIARHEAASEIRAASGDTLAQLTAERDGACRALLG